jgi:hypothetical protein
MMTFCEFWGAVRPDATCEHWRAVEDATAERRGFE